MRARAQHDIDIGVGDAEAAAEQMIAPQPTAARRREDARGSYMYLYDKVSGTPGRRLLSRSTSSSCWRSGRRVKCASQRASAGRRSGASW
jgi:hypothetical protein